MFFSNFINAEFRIKTLEKKEANKLDFSLRYMCSIIIILPQYVAFIFIWFCQIISTSLNKLPWYCYLYSFA